MMRGDEVRLFIARKRTASLLLWEKNAFENKLKSQDAFLLLLCHEVGHIATARDEKSPGSELQSDYWATRTCMPAVLPYFEKIEMFENPFSEQIKTSCQKKFSTEKDISICERSISAAYLFRVSKIGMGIGGIENYDKSAPVVFSDNFEELSCTKYVNDLPPYQEQCWFNHLVAGSLNIKPPICFNDVFHGNNLETESSSRYCRPISENPYLIFGRSTNKNLCHPSRKEFLEKHCEAIKAKTIDQFLNKLIFNLFD